MSDLLIFGFGLLVTCLVGSALATLIAAKNRMLEASASRRDSSVDRPSYQGPPRQS